jgi:hypothetical protein
MIKKAEVFIGMMEIRVNVIAFLLKAFSQDDLDTIMKYIEENPFIDDLTGCNGQIVIDEQQKIVYTGSKLAGFYIANKGYRSTSKRHTVSVFKKPIPESSAFMIQELVQCKKKKRKKKKALTLTAIPHNLQPVLDEIGSDKPKK